MQNKKRIPVNENVAYTHWEMPDLTGVKRRIAQRLSELEEESSAEEPIVDLTPPTQEEIAQLKEDARQEGYAAGVAEGHLAGSEEGRALGYKAGEETGQETGFQAGYQRGLDQAEQEVDQQLARLQSIIEQLQGPLTALDYEVENALLSLVDLVCRAILRREIKLERSYLTEVLREAVAALPAGHQRLRISLNPEDLNLAEAACQDFLEDYRLIGDSEITLGGAKIETLQSLVDSTLESRYKKIIDKLLTSAYQPAIKDIEPLPEHVLATPDTDPLEEAEFTEPETLDNQQASDSTEVELGPEPVAQVSLQRGKTPRNEQPIEPLVNQEADSLGVEDAVEPTVEEKLNEPIAESIPEQINEDFKQQESLDPTEFASEESLELSSDELSYDLPDVDKSEADALANNEMASEEVDSLEEAPAEVTDFLDEFSEDEAELEFETLLADTDTEYTAPADEPTDLSEPAVDQTDVSSEALNMDGVDTGAVEIESKEVEEEDWSPESVHDDRYLEDLLENTWLDDMQEATVDKPLDVIPDDLDDTNG